MARKSKKTNIADAARKTKVTKKDLDIEERLAGCGRKEPEHIIYIGELVERTLKAEFGAVIKALTAGRISMELEHKKSSGLTSDWHLGRASMGNDLWNDLEQYVLDKDTVLYSKDPVQEDESVTVFNYSPE